MVSLLSLKSVLIRVIFELLSVSGNCRLLEGVAHFFLAAVLRNENERRPDEWVVARFICLAGAHE
jgi:hypothetical protein